jgi:hypothetical protein
MEEKTEREQVVEELRKLLKTTAKNPKKAK